MNNPLNNGKITRTTIIVFLVVTLLVVGIVSAAVYLQMSEPKTVVGVDPPNAAPGIDSYTPSSLTPSVVEGANLAFTVSAHDPEGQPLTYRWTLDNSDQSTSASYNFLSTTVSTHTVKVTVSDGTSDASITWIVTVTESNVGISVTLTVSSNTLVRTHSNLLTLTGTITDPNGNGLIMSFYQNGAKIGQAYVSNLQAAITIYGDTLVKGDNVFTAGP